MRGSERERARVSLLETIPSKRDPFLGEEEEEFTPRSILFSYDLGEVHVQSPAQKNVKKHTLNTPPLSPTPK